METKLLNGIRVPLSDAEIAEKTARESEWQAGEAERAKQQAIKEINAIFEAEIAAIKAGYTEDEIKSWDQQLTEAKAYQTNQLAQTPLIDAIVSERGGTKDELVLRIATNAATYAQIFGEALGRKQKAIIDLG